MRHNPFTETSRPPSPSSGRTAATLVAILGALAFPVTAAAQNSAISGRVWSEDGLLLDAAGVRLVAASDTTRQRVTETDRTGYFAFRDVAPGTWVLVVTRLGYARHEQTVEVAAGEPLELDITLEAQAIVLEGIEVDAERSRARVRFEESAGTTVQDINRVAMKSLPTLAETDPIRAVEVLPGVNTVSDFTAAFNVRGGSADQNLILLDYIPVFNPFHLGGIFSVVNADMVQRAELRAGGFPAEYGGRVSSVLTVETDVGDGEFSVDAGVSLLASRVAMDGSMPKGFTDQLGLATTRWRVSARRSYLDVLVKPWFKFPYHLTDLQGAFEAWSRGGGRLRITGYTGRDVLDLADVGDNPLPIQWEWGNDAVGGSWTNPMSGGGSMDVGASYSRFISDFEFTETRSRFTSNIEESAVRANLELRPTGRTRWKSGVAGKRVVFDNRIEAGGTVFNESAGSGWEAAAYSQIHWTPNTRWLVEGGLRVDHWLPDPGDSETTLSPRFAVKRFLRDRNAAVRLAGGRYSQFVHSLRDEEVPLGVDFWVLAGTRAPRIVSDQLQLGVESFFGAGDEWYASLEGYYRTFDGVVSVNAAEDPNDELDDLVAGDGWSYGVDLFLRRDQGATTGWVTLSFLRTERTFPDTRSGLDPPPVLTYPPVFDRRVDIDLVLRRPLNWWGVVAGIRANFGTGIPYTRPLGQYDVYRRRLADGLLDYNNGSAVALGPRNGSRYPARHRLDVSFRKTIEREWGRLIPYLSIINLYNQKNVLFYFYDFEPDPPTRSGVSMIPFLPTFGVEVSF
ncbi:MAG: TonB-dependent receptor [Gemmatimonadetes bacterium]|nr:TonB-dependent receptor [Gemmatimonadota bacterium]MYH52183.1 TonB-dependent receptor [Gemmatimonadota bacterium]MYK65065.1 TonB-dependent receptor [Gemmatimonadota bacterium]